jgi:hypothetical protein
MHGKGGKKNINMHKKEGYFVLKERYEALLQVIVWLAQRALP